MTHSEAFLAAKYGGGFHTAFTNDYLLKHGNFFMKPTLHADGFVYPAISEAARYRIFKDVKCEVLDHPLNFAIKQEKPPTPPASSSPSPSKSPPSPGDPRASPTILNGQSSKSATWILGKQKLSWDDSTVASYNPDTKMFRCVVCNAVGFLSRIAEHYLGTHTSAKVFQCLHCPYSSTWSRCVRMHMAKHHGVPNAPPSLWKGQPLLEEIFQLLTNLKTSVDSQGRERLDPELSDKKFVCPKCPYTTDRRDLYLRHENIHKEDKPYHCYVCFKLFNRADHVKKHFLRIHRGHPYDISLVRRRPPRVANNNNNQSINNHQSNNVKSNNFSVDKLIANDKPKVEEEDAMDLSRRGDPPSPISDASSGQPPCSDKQQQQPKSFQCPSCEWEGVDSWCLRRHMNVHLKGFECPMCDFRAGKAERLFTHVYRAHRKLVCTKCKFMTDLAQDFEVHIKECCVEIMLGNVFDKISEDSHNSSDDASAADLKFDPHPNPFALPDHPKLFDRPNRMTPAGDLKGSISLIPLHNSISYCYPAANAQGFGPDHLGSNLNGLNGTVNGFNGKVNGLNGEVLNGLNGSVHGLPSFGVVNGGVKPISSKMCKVDVKAELASPVQSSTDSGAAVDLAAAETSAFPADIACWHCGCEFADLRSLDTHTELYHREQEEDSGVGPLPSAANTKTKPTPRKKTRKKFCCAICNFRSDRQRTILEHMRFHTGEVLECGACQFRTVCDSTLEGHVRDQHADGEKRCPHCGLPADHKVPFIRHYRKCHHSKSCSRCRVIKRSLDPKLAADELSLILQTSQLRGVGEQVRPYLHHNPYSRRSNNNSITPYSHCDAAMSKVAVAIPPSLQRSAAESFAESSAYDSTRERKSRKQTMPRKLLHHPQRSRNGLVQKQISPRKILRRKNARGHRIPNAENFVLQQVGLRTTNTSRNGHPCKNEGHRKRNAVHDRNIGLRTITTENAIHQNKKAVYHSDQDRNTGLRSRNAVCIRTGQGQIILRKAAFKGWNNSICDTIIKRRPYQSHIRKKLLKFANVPSGNKRRCVMGHDSPLAFRNGVNYVRHLFWCHHAKRYRCHLCGEQFCHEYQVLLHRRRVHENLLQ